MEASKFIRCTVCDYCGNTRTIMTHQDGAQTCENHRGSHELKIREKAGDIGFEDDGRLETYRKINRLPYKCMSMETPVNTGGR